MLGDVEERVGLAEFLQDDFAGLADDFGAGVEVAVDGVAEAHQAMALGAAFRGLDEARAVVVLVVDRLEHLHDGDVGAAVERAGERADRGGERGEKVGAGRADHARRRRAAVLLVVGVHQQNEIQRLRDLGDGDVFLIRLREHLVQKIIAEGNILRVHERQAVLVPVNHRAERADFRDGDGGGEIELLEVLLEIVRGELGMISGERPNECAQHDHRRGLLGKARDQILHVRVDRGVLAEELAEGKTLLLSRQLAVDDEVSGLDIFGLRRELLDRIAAMAEDAVVAVEVGDAALAGAGVAVALIVENVAGVLPELAGINGFFAFSAEHHGEADFLVVDLEQGGLLHTRGETTRAQFASVAKQSRRPGATGPKNKAMAEAA